jgi:phospholipid/cholesterol/gamma-HCH transport system substrate-binding protein
MARHGVAETLTGAAVLVVAVAFLAYAVAHSGRTAGSGYSLQARFDHIDGLNVGGDVRIAGVKVGTVTEQRIDPKTFSAIVTLTVRNDIQLPKDSAASITSESLLGGKYISLSPGGDDADFKPGDMITITQSSVSLEELLGKFIFSATSLSSSKQPADPSQDGGTQGGSAQGASSQGASSQGGNTQGGSARNNAGGGGDEGRKSGGGAALAPLSK